MLRSSSYPWQKASILSPAEATLSWQTADAIITVIVGPLGHQRHPCESPVASKLPEASLWVFCDLKATRGILVSLLWPLGHQTHPCESPDSLIAVPAVPTQARAGRQSAVRWLIQTAWSHISSSLPSEQDLRLLVRSLEGGIWLHLFSYSSISFSVSQWQNLP